MLKYLSDQAGVPLRNGDTPDSLEFRLMLPRYPKDDLFLYYMMERLVVPYLNKAYGERPFEELYARVVDAWFVKPGFPLRTEEQHLAYFRQLYQEKVGAPFVLEVNENNFERFDYANGGDCRFCEIGRSSKMVRDSVLLSRLDEALDHHDRVLVTFGHGHALALEPALRQLIAKKRR
ncbi:hypothetical protein K3G39_19790 [Pontibacter sp. HSC-14F20]|uniref:hypothetical protein n=1 Tax=Pontibacter sp. HSC-14F20 TaxID=2864136 RepID=UPI001C72D14B|nr:hypothetical protein [Pontibacter sp. HSC-14F20]MBX0335483.1 hypothetical protein [Pontibacter sp. HSC-14F20]